MFTQPVTIFEDVNYGGSHAGLNYGAFSTMSSIGFPNNAVSSVKVGPFTRLSLYDDEWFGGAVLHIYGPKDIPNLWEYTDRMEDRASSIRVTRMEPTIDEKMKCCQGLSTGNCGEFNPSSALCGNVMGEYCTSAKMSENVCRTWCRANPNSCDSAVAAFCNTNTGDSFCTCLKSPAAIKGIINPKCVDRACLDTGYLSSNMQATSCPSVVNCDLKISLVNSGVILSNTIPVQQNCGNTTPAQTPPVTQIAQTTPKTTQPILFNSLVFILIFIALLILSIMLGILFANRSSQD